MSEEDTQPMSSCRPYLLRGVYQWIVDNEMTPYILVDASANNVQVPNNFITNGKIVLNISPGAVKDLDISNEQIFFNARFSGQSTTISVPMHATMAIYAKENGRGMVFTDDYNPPEPTKNAHHHPQLRVVK